MWTSIITSIVGLFTGQIPAITKAIVDARVQMANSKNELERIQAEERLKSLEARRDVLIAEAQTPWNSIARFILMVPFAVVLWTYIVYDKVVCPWWHGSEGVDAVSRVCSTDDLSQNLWSLLFIVVGFYFLTDITRIIKR